MVVGVVLDDTDVPCVVKKWPGNTTDVKTLVQVVAVELRPVQCLEVLCRGRQGNHKECNPARVRKTRNRVPDILGARMRNVLEVKRDVLCRRGKLFRKSSREGTRAKDPSPLKVQEVWWDDPRYIVCLNPKQARKDAADREAILASLGRTAKGLPPKKLGRKTGVPAVLSQSLKRTARSIDRKKVEQEARFDGKRVLKTNTPFVGQKRGAEVQRIMAG